MSKRNKQKGIKLVIIFGLIALAIVGVLLARNANKKTAEEVINYTVKQETYKNVIEISGNVKAAQTQSLKASGAGSVTNVYVKEGDTVKKGQLLLVMNTTEQEYNLAKQDYDIAQKRINGSPKEIKLMEEQRSVLEQKLADRKIVATFDGVIAKFTAAVGDYLEAKDEVGVLIDRQYLSATVEVVETDATKLRAGQVVHFTFPAYSDDPIDGYVVSYPSVGRITTRGATVVDVDVRIENPPEEILPNYSFTGNIEISAPETVLLVERQAISFKNGNSFAEVLQSDGSFKQVSVSVVQYDASYVNVISGLLEGDVVRGLSSTGSSGRLTVNKNSGTSSRNEEARMPAGAPGARP